MNIEVGTQAATMAAVLELRVYQQTLTSEFLEETFEARHALSHLSVKAAHDAHKIRHVAGIGEA